MAKKTRSSQSASNQFDIYIFMYIKSMYGNAIKWSGFEKRAEKGGREKTENSRVKKKILERRENISIKSAAAMSRERQC